MKRAHVITVAFVLVTSFCGIADAGIQVSLEEQLRLLERGERPARLISGAEYRVGVFTFEDPDGTGLGDALARLMSHEVLMNSVSSIGVLTFKGGLAPSGGSQLSYFDKVEKVAGAQDVTLAMWGMVQRHGAELVVDTYVTLPSSSVERYFTWQLRLPDSMGGNVLGARLRPDRIRVQALAVPERVGETLKAAAHRISVLKSAPRSDATATGELPLGEIFYVLAREGDWVRLQVRGGANGWMQLRGHCTGECSPFLEAGAFGGALLKYMAAGKLPPVTSALTAEALAVREQIEALDGLDGGTPEEIESNSLRLAARWVGHSRPSGADAGTGIERGQGVPPGGAAFANVHALAELALDLQLAYLAAFNPTVSPDRLFDQLTLNPDRVRRIAERLAEASLLDPRNTDVLNNLAVLFGYVGDDTRAMLAENLARELGR